MLKKHMAACLVASAFITMPVLAQTSTTPGATSPGANQPAMGASGGASGSGSAASGASGASGRFITQQQGNQWRASRLIGLAVYGSNNDRIGDINEVLVDRQGKADAVVVGVGGFLGIGEKNVALPFDAFEWMMEDAKRTASASGTGATGTAGTAGRAPGTGTAGTAGTGAMGTAGTGPSAGVAGSPPRDAASSTASTSAAGGSAARSGSAERGYPDHAVLRMSKADLENAPTFRYMGDTSASSGAATRSTGGSGSGMGSGSAPASGGASSPTTAPRQ